MTTIFGIRLSKRIENSSKLQEILSKYGCYIKTRIGLHDVSCGVCSPYGIILLEFLNNESATNEISMELQSISGLKYAIMEL